MSATALTFSSIAYAQPAPQAAQAPATEEIVVTGTRIVRDGYEAPTPLTVLGVDQIQTSATSNIADFVNTLPSMAGSSTPQTSQASISSGLGGLNTVNLRAIGAPRTLVLLDGQRSVGSTVTGLVDVNNFPQALISRVDVVTGGASAAYGSDALAGVINFVLDKKFTGIKGDVSGGVTTYGDDRQWTISLTGGVPFAGDRGHFLLSGEANHIDGILQNNRRWNTLGAAVVNNPAYTATNGLPRQITLLNVGLDQGSPGGIITSGPLKGIEFGPGGVPRQFNYGLAADPWSQGGDWASTRTNSNQSLDSPTARHSLFARTSFDITDSIDVFAQYSWNHANVAVVDGMQFNVNNLVVKSDNPFIPASVAAQVAAQKLTSFTLGSMNQDIGPFGATNDRTTQRLVLGGNGGFDAFDSAWTWDAYWQKGWTHSSEKATGATQKDKFAFAIDAVRNPANGQIVCRSTLTNPTNGCVPWNLMGIGVNSAAALNYIFGGTSGNSMTGPGLPMRVQHFEQNVFAATVHGSPFSDWAGPVSLAFGAEHRAEKVYGASDPDSLKNNWFVGNYLPNFGAYNVTEGFVEAVVPLAKDQVWAKSLDLNAAVRATSYSTSGYVTTWKVGATYAPIDDIRFRATRSRDIRAPNLSELFSAGTANTNSVFDRFNNNVSVQYQGLQVGNADLKPEVADTTGLGVVLQPTFVPGFSASFDYYNIDIAEAIGTVSAQNIVDFCYGGNQVYCPAIIRGQQNGVNVISQIRITPFNLVTQIERGYDIEASYRARVDNIVSDWGGDLTLRFLATHYLKNFSNNGINPATDVVGQNSGGGLPNWRYTASISYSNDPITVGLTGRGVSAGTYNNTYIACTSGCPVSTVNNITQDQNHLDGAFYLDAALTYKFSHADNGADAEAYLNIRNVFNTDPVIFYNGPGGTTYLTISAVPQFYDVLGRVFRVGIRFKM